MQMALKTLYRPSLGSRHELHAFGISGIRGRDRISRGGASGVAGEFVCPRGARKIWRLPTASATQRGRGGTQFTMQFIDNSRHFCVGRTLRNLT